MELTNPHEWQHFSRVERVTGIEPALSAWEEFLSHRVSVSCNDIGGLSYPLVTRTGLFLWPVRGPVLSARADSRALAGAAWRGAANLAARPTTKE